MAIDILKVEPHKVSRDLRGYTILFYGQPKQLGHLVSNDYLIQSKKLET